MQFADLEGQCGIQVLYRCVLLLIDVASWSRNKAL